MGLCNSISCPSGYTPIADTTNVDCDDDLCEVSQCCETSCSYYACPDGYITISDAEGLLCHETGCTIGNCCGRLCSSHACPANYVPIADAASILCDESRCTTASCCGKNALLAYSLLAAANESILLCGQYPPAMFGSFVARSDSGVRRSTIEVHPDFTEAPHVGSSIPHPNTDISENRIASG